MSDLTTRLNDTANVNRLATVEAAYAGSAGSQSNFKGQWKGFDTAGNGMVAIDGKTYKAATIGSTSIPSNSQVILRVGKGIKTSHW